MDFVALFFDGFGSGVGGLEGLLGSLLLEFEEKVIAFLSTYKLRLQHYITGWDCYFL